MDKSLYISMTGAKQNMLAQAVHSNNLANASTSGFKADFIGAMSERVHVSAPLDTRAYSVPSAPITNFESGSLQDTGRDLDISVDGRGWIAVIDESGTESYTRAGRLSIDSLGRLLNERGDQVLGNGGPVVLPDFEKIEIGRDGTISVRALGQGPETLVEADRIKLVNPEPDQLEKRENGRIYAREGALAVDATVRLRTKFLENSNVNAIDELTSIVSLARQFELQVKMMQTVSEMSESSSRLLQVQV